MSSEVFHLTKFDALQNYEAQFDDNVPAKASSIVTEI